MEGETATEYVHVRLSWKAQARLGVPEAERIDQRSTHGRTPQSYRREVPMGKTRATFLLTALMAVSFMLTAGSVVLAAKQWSCWHWDHNDIGFSSHAGGGWGSIIGSEANDWEAATCINFTGGNEIIGDADFYGATGWLGIARLLEVGPGCTIVAADALMNRSYLDGPGYGDTADRHVTCQEIGHTLGLDHTRGKAETCMNDRTLIYPYFAQDEADLVDSITGGCDGGGGCGEKGTSCTAGSDCCSGVCKNNGTCR